MAKQGLLGQVKPAAGTNTVLYSAPVASSASTVLSVAAQGSADSYDIAIKDHDQNLTLDASTYKLHKGDVITGYRFNLATNIPVTSALQPGDAISSEDGEKNAIFESYYLEPFTTINVKEIAIRSLTLTSVVGTFSVGETISKGTSPNDTVATIFGVQQGSGSTILYVGPSTLNGTGTEFTDADALTASGGGTAAVETGGVGTGVDEYIFSTDAGVTYDLFLGTDLTVFSDRVYRFDTSDSSMSGTDFKLSITVNGEWGPDNTAGTGDDGTEFTTGKTTNGTAGSGGAYIQYDFSQATLAGNLYFYDGDTGTAAKSAYGGSDRLLIVSTDFAYSAVYVYDIEGTWANTVDSFLANGVSYTVQSQTAGAYGYVRDFTGTACKVLKGLNSADFTTSDSFQDSPLLNTTSRSAVTISSIALATTAVSAEMFLKKDNAIASDVTEETKSLVLGPGERLLVESNGGHCSFNIIGFEDASTAFPTRNFGTGAAADVVSGGGS
jgi:hypothetical protein